MGHNSVTLRRRKISRPQSMRSVGCNLIEMAVLVVDQLAGDAEEGLQRTEWKGADCHDGDGGAFGGGQKEN